MINEHQHMIIEHQDENDDQKNTRNKEDLKRNKNHKCAICNKKYTYCTWHEHMRTVHSNVNLRCNQCDKSFKCQKYLYRHIQNIHLNKAQLKKKKNFDVFTCKQCPKVFNSGDCLNKHVKNCHGQKVKCPICGSALKSEVYLPTHMRRVHCDSSKKSICQICGKQFKSKRQLKIHVSNTHEKKLCPNCGEMYTVCSFYYHVNTCKIGIVPQNVKEEKIYRDDMHANVTVDDNDQVHDDNGEIYANSNDQDDVKVDIQLKIENKGHFKRGIKTTRDINENNQIYLNDMEDVDVDDSGLLNRDFNDQDSKIRGGDNISFDQDICDTNGVTVKEIDVKEGSVQGLIGDHANGDSNDQIDKGEVIRHFCKICNRKLKSEERVRIHIKNAHSNILPLKCPHCGKFLYNLRYFSVHVKKCSKTVEAP